MDFLPFHAEDRKPGVDYVRCQKEFEIQLMLLQEDIKNGFGWTQKRGDGYGICNISWTSNQNNFSSSPPQERSTKVEPIPRIKS
ncbi:hypothetical protein FPOAC2_05472 [Fusarium poae]|uniref:Uncharacterized protein n=1 Tax=Fusarium poae TaxID=36050 RepID=A0A1B8AUV5_FUSPO|nr:hypothetical protein FPOAC1_005366 [Fusarium poae]KAG8672105.1 hypothetical protein FPOAC1_005366 [Fusarium poae]OBS24312.1 hypothetical protein FPOA_04857 [Fusarium poae]